MGYLEDRLEENYKSDMYPFHMPGHKRRMNGHDITEIEGFDDLHDAKGVLKDLQERIAGLYGAKHAFLLVNGSTGGILAAISAACPFNSTVLMARNCHKSVYNAVFLRRLKAEYIHGELDDAGINPRIEPENVDNLMHKTGAKVVIITSPTYEGVISDVKAIAEVVHRNKGVLIVDCAHGAHFGVIDKKHENPVGLGADYVIMSVHKTLPALTQTAVLCLGEGADYERTKKFFDIYVSSSPSYILMESVEKCFDIIRDEGRKLWAEYESNLTEFRKKCHSLEKLYLYEPEGDYDEGKLVICTDRAAMDGKSLSDRLRQDYHLEMEMAAGQYVIALTSFCDTKAGFERLFKALDDVDRDVAESADRKYARALQPEKMCEAWELETADVRTVRINEAEGKIAADYVYIYPPGIPWLVPGEVIPANFWKQVEEYEEYGIEVHGIENGCIRIAEEKNG